MVEVRIKWSFGKVCLKRTIGLSRLYIRQQLDRLSFKNFSALILHSCKINEMLKPLKDGIRSIVKIDARGNVHKTFRGTDRDKRHANEVRVLKALESRGCTNVPRLLDYDDDGLWILMTHCGHPVESTISRKKNDQLYKQLEEDFGVRHDDPEPRNITYSQSLGAFCVIDFELAEILDYQEEEESNEPVLSYEWFGISDKGRKAKNEDSWRVLHASNEGIRWDAMLRKTPLSAKPVFAAVADGIGGAGNGDLASNYLINSLRWELEKINPRHLENTGTEIYQQLVNDLNERLGVAQISNDELSGMGATLALASLSKNELFVANVGDSRVYLFREDELTQLSQDHTFAWRQHSRGQITEREFRQHPRKSVLYEAINGDKREIHPFMTYQQIQAGDTILICSDGLIDGMWEREIKETLKEGEANLSLEETVQKLLKSARQTDDRDDCTMILFRIS